MVVSDISLSSGIRGSLYNLKENASLLQKTQQRLSTGKVVNTPLDNATNYFAATNHLSRANNIILRKDNITEGIQAIRAAESAITAISAILTSMKAVATQASTTLSQEERNSYAKTYVDLRAQINLLATDSGYRGTNLLGNEDLTIEFSEQSGDSVLRIAGFDSSANGLGVGNKVTSGTGGTVPVQTASFSTYNHQAGVQFSDSFAIGNLSQTTIDATLQVSFVNTAPTGFNVGVSVDSAIKSGDTLTVTGSVGQNVPAAVSAVVTVPNPNPPPATITTTRNIPTSVNITFGGNLERTFATWSNPENVYEVFVNGVLQVNNYITDSKGNIVFDTSSEPTAGQVVTFIRGDTWDTKESAMISLKQVDGALDILRRESKYLSSTLNVVTTRLDFNSTMTNILTIGADNLTLAEMNQESANSLALQIQMELGITTLSMASRFQQVVLNLFN